MDSYNEQEYSNACDGAWGLSEMEMAATVSEPVESWAGATTAAGRIAHRER